MTYSFNPTSHSIHCPPPLSITQTAYPKKRISPNAWQLVAKSSRYKLT
uniref:Uncharacterized protein n=1 Tax=Rhizophora mucronata TaxID=61149 RepID=A0A2P2QZT4_RHIMU